MTLTKVRGPVWDALQNELVVNVRDEGAIGDGVADDTAAIQAVIDANENMGSVVLMPTGTYRLTASLEPKSGMRIVAWGARIVHAMDTHPFECTAVVNDFHIEGLYSENEGAPGGSEPTFFFADATAGGRIHNCSFVGVECVGYGQGYSVDGLATLLPKTAAGADLPTDFTGNEGVVKWDRCIIRNTLEETFIGSAGGHGIFTRADYSSIINCRIYSMQGGILLGANNCIIADNQILNCWFDNAVRTSGNNLTISGNYIELTLADGIGMTNSQHVTIANNVFVNCGNGAIRPQAGCEDMTITGNVCEMGTTTAHFIRGFNDGTEPPCKRITISNNTIQGPGSGGNPIVFLTTVVGPHEDIMIQNNTFSDMDTTGLGSASQGPFAFIVIGSPGATRGARCFAMGNNWSNAAPTKALANARLTWGLDDVQDFFHFTDGDTWNLGLRRGSVRFGIGGVGSIAFQQADGILATLPVVQGGGAGEYQITFDRIVYVESMNWTAFGGNQFHHATYNIPGGSGGNNLQTTNQITMTVSNNANPPVPFFPNFGCTVQLDFMVTYYPEFWNLSHN